ncbi:MAG: oligoendopeptidase pepF/M3 family [Acidimicrobiales bacterium]|nr:oligoendopeptidase pepF/M3 family [Acidimicrobiales bacterium]
MPPADVVAASALAEPEPEPDAPPRWDVSGVFPALGSREQAVADEELRARLGRLGTRFDELDIRAGEPRDATDADVAAVEELLPEVNAVLEGMRLLGAYLYAHVSTDARDDRAATMLSRFQADTASMTTLDKRLSAWLATVGAEALIERSAQAGDHAYALRRAAAAAEHQMSEAEEDLAAELSLTGGRAWAKLHGDLTARLTVAVRRPGGAAPEIVPMSMARGLATDPDAAVRRAAFEGELEAWDTVVVPLASALNAFKGEANALNRRRGWTDSLAPALFRNGIDRPTLQAMQEAVVASLPDWSRYLRAKAALLGHEDGLPWWDLLAPVGDRRRFRWTEATDAVRDAFAGFSPRLADLVVRAAGERWIDAEPRAGKAGGAFCMSVQGEESRVLLSFDGSFDSVQTLAHELGHAYHNANLGFRTPLQRQTPMALAETASIFCETIMVQAGLTAAGDDRGARLAILDGDLSGACQVVVDIHSRFLFEQAMTEERAAGVLPVARLRELMLDAQRSAYGDGLDPAHLHRDMWAVKGHYYTAYYNWPYTFGLLFGIGLYAEYERDPERFRLGYDDLLSATGLADGAELAARFGIDVRDLGFWTASLDVLRARIAELEALAHVDA